MSQIAIKINKISKRFRIGELEKKQDTLVGAIKLAIIKPFRNMMRLRELTHFKNDNSSEDSIIWALKNISLSIKQKEVVGMIGANGAGKSTLLKILASITQPTTGSVELVGRVASLLEIGTGFHPELTGRENVYLNGTILGMKKSEIDEKFDEIIEFSGISKFIDTPIKRYSSGMAVRLAFSVAAHLDAEILLIDEVLAVGDYKFQQKCLGKMNDIANTGRTVIFVSHNLAVVEELCSRCILLEKGRVVKFGNASEVVNEYIKKQSKPIDFDINQYRLSSRKLSRVISISDFQILDKNFKKIKAIKSGQDVTFKIDYESNGSVSLTNAVFEIRAKDNYSNVIFALSTYLLNENFEHLQPEGSVYCNVPCVSLFPNNYLFSIICYVNHDLSDIIENFVSIPVVQSNMLLKGQSINKALHGLFYLPHKWSDSKSSEK